MLGICFILGLLALALAAPTPNSHKLRDVAPPVGSLLIKPSVEVDSGSHVQGRATIAVRSASSFDVVDGPIALGATLTIRNPFPMPSTVKQIPPPLALNTSPSPVSSLNQNPRWGPSDISNVLFGLITSILGIVAVVVTYHLHRRRSQRGQPDEPAELDDTSTSGTGLNSETQPLQDLNPSDTPINGALAGLNQDDTQSSATPGAVD